MKRRPSLFLLGTVLSIHAAVGCSSSEEPAPGPSTQVVKHDTKYFQLTLVSAKDAAGKELVEYFGPIPLWLKASVATATDGSMTFDEDARANLAGDSLQSPIELTSAQASGKTTLQMPEKKDVHLSGQRLKAPMIFGGSFNVDEVASFTFDGASFKEGAIVKATGKLETPDETTAGVAALEFRITSDKSDTTFQTNGASFGGKYLFWQDPLPRFTKPVTLSASPTLRVGTGQPFDFDPFARGISTGSIWNVTGPGSTSFPGDDRPRELTLPDGVDFQGKPVPGRVVRFEAVPVDYKPEIDFSTAKDVITTQGARIADDPECEKGRCLVIESPPLAAGERCTQEAQAAIAAAPAKLGDALLLRYRILADMPDGHQRIAFLVPLEQGTSISFSGSLEAAAAGASHRYDGGWVNQKFSKTFIAHIGILGCQKGIKVLVQGVTKEVL